MEVIKVTPRGYCHGVVNALNIVANTLADLEVEKPIYIIGEIVHNKNVTKAFDDVGAITLNGPNRKEIIKQVSSGTIVITAHGIDPHLISEAKERGLNVVDATCSDVYKTHDVIKNKIECGYEIIYIGKHGHPEPEGVIGINPNKIHLVETYDDIDILNLESTLVCITNQTTMSVWDTKNIMDYAKKKYPHLEEINEICFATKERQGALFDLPLDVDMVFVVGDPNSNNTNRLVEIVEEKLNKKALRINTIEDINIQDLLKENIKKLAVTSGASTPTIITKEVITFLEQFEKDVPKTWKNISTFELTKTIPRIRLKKAITK